MFICHLKKQVIYGFLKFRCWGINLDKNISYQKKISSIYCSGSRYCNLTIFLKKLIIHIPCFILSKFARPREIRVSKMVKVGGWVWAGGLWSEGCLGLSEAVGDRGVSPGWMVLIFQDVSLRHSLSFKDTDNRKWARSPVKGLPGGWLGLWSTGFYSLTRKELWWLLTASLKGQTLAIVSWFQIVTGTGYILLCSNM